MTPGLSALATCSAQVALVVAAATAAAWLLRVRAPHVRLWFWRATGLLCLVLPFLGRPPSPGPIAVTFRQADAAVGAARALPVSDGLGTAVGIVLVAGVAWRTLRLAVGLERLRRLRRDSTPAQLDREAEALRAAIAPRAELRWTECLPQPVAFGMRRPLILLPRSLASLAPEARQAVLCHELLHVARRDWLWIVAEEAARAAMWFHPAAWWLLDQLHVSREQVVDALVVQRTGARRPYMEALLWFAESPVAAIPATAFLHRRHLRSRLEHLAQEPHMSTARVVVTAMILVLLMGGTGRAVVSALPLDLAGIGLAQTPQARLEIRLAEPAPAAGLTAATAEGSGQTIYLAANALVTAADVAAATVVDAGSGRFSVDVAFLGDASDRLALATAAHVGRPVAILLDGRVVAAPVVRSPIGRSALLTGAFTRAQAEAIVDRLPPRAPGAQPRPAPWAAFFGGAAPAGAEQQRPYTTKDDGVTLPRVLLEVKPVYTQAAMDAKIQGDVEMAVVVETDGTVGDVAVTKSLDTEHGLDQAAVDAARQWHFKPGTRDGKPVPVQVDLQMRFTLK